ncbi:hypothetical protein GLOIN_2v1483994 [Rhizophagus irregularis DAOM 181602=DAOM 197198]|nr:hypothetical protein GLOIN_2v1483994 [Rhizophagus irregularis DAOM 181602=DAOM 197198]
MAFHLRKYRNWTYFSFLSFHHDVIVISSFLNGLNRNDDVWVKQFLREAKCLDPNNFTAIEKEARIFILQRDGNSGLPIMLIRRITGLTNLVSTPNSQFRHLNFVFAKQDCSHYAKELQTFWEGVIEECGDTFANAFEVDIEKNNMKISDDREDQLINLSLQDKDELLATRKILKYFSSLPPRSMSMLLLSCYVNVVLSLEEYEALLYIPPSIISNDCFKSKNTTRVNVDSPISILLWEDFFKEVSHFYFKEHPRFERPNFVDWITAIQGEKFIVMHTRPQLPLSCETINFGY